MCHTYGALLACRSLPGASAGEGGIARTWAETRPHLSRLSQRLAPPIAANKGAHSFRRGGIAMHAPEAAAVLFIIEVVIASLAGGVLGSIAGIGGGVIIVPVLTIFLGMNIRYAIGASIVSVIAVSSGAGSTYVKDRITNVRIAMFLEVSTAAGALVGAGLIAPHVHGRWLEVAFGVLLLASLIPIFAKFGEELPAGIQNDRLADA